jgi:ACS family hexuronate transporter-like MFS transporter
VLIQLAAVSLAHGYGYGPLLAICSCSYLIALGCVQLLIPVIVPVEQESGAIGMAH